MVEISVEDEGPGFPRATSSRSSTGSIPSGRQGEKFGQHSGLGLSISRQIVEALRGRISAENRRGIGNKVMGARFVVTLPRV